MSANERELARNKRGPNPYTEHEAAGHDRGCDSLSTPDHSGPCRCRCGKPVGEPSPKCEFHKSWAAPAPVSAESTGGLSDEEREALRVAWRGPWGAAMVTSAPPRLLVAVERILSARDAEHARHEAAVVARVRAEERERALREAADEAHREARWVMEQVNRGSGIKPDLLDTVMRVEWVLRDRLAREADREAGRG